MKISVVAYPRFVSEEEKTEMVPYPQYNIMSGTTELRTRMETSRVLTYQLRGEPRENSNFMFGVQEKSEAEEPVIPIDEAGSQAYLVEGLVREVPGENNERQHDLVISAAETAVPERNTVTPASQ